MKIGFIFECPRGGTDQLVIEFLANKLDPNIEIINRFTNTNKPVLIQQCGEQTARLLAQGCERVIIVWDLIPRWGDTKVKPYCKRDVALVRAALHKAGVDEERVRLLCVTAEIEVFLIADERVLEKLLSRPTRAADCPFKKNPERIKRPKEDLQYLYERHGYTYDALTDSLRILNALENFNRLGPIPAFKRLKKLVLEADFACSRHLAD